MNGGFSLLSLDAVVFCLFSLELRRWPMRNVQAKKIFPERISSKYRTFSIDGIFFNLKSLTWRMKNELHGWKSANPIDCQLHSMIHHLEQPSVMEDNVCALSPYTFSFLCIQLSIPISRLLGWLHFAISCSRTIAYWHMHIWWTY